MTDGGQGADAGSWVHIVVVDNAGGVGGGVLVGLYFDSLHQEGDYYTKSTQVS
jgi:hypothetical protein